MNYILIYMQRSFGLLHYRGEYTMNFPAEFVVRRNLLKYSEVCRLCSLGCPEYLISPVSEICKIWAICFGDCSEGRARVISIEEFLIAADFAVMHVRGDIGIDKAIENYELWYWVMSIAQKILPRENYLLLDREIKSPRFQVLLSTWK